VRQIGREGAHKASAQGGVGQANSVGLGEGPVQGSPEITKGYLDPARSSDCTRLHFRQALRPLCRGGQAQQTVSYISILLRICQAVVTIGNIPALSIGKFMVSQGAPRAMNAPTRSTVSGSYCTPKVRVAHFDS